MVKSLDTGKDKIQKICDILRRETLEPAGEQAEKIVSDARAEAERLLAQAREQVAELEAAAHQRILQERSVFDSSVNQAVRQSVETLRQQVEGRLFSEELGHTLASATADPKVIATLINSLVEAIDREGIGVDLAAIVAKTVKVEEVNNFLLERVAELLKEGVQVGDFRGGAKLRLSDRQITIDISDEALVELLGRYLRKDFRAKLFGKEN